MSQINSLAAQQEKKKIGTNLIINVTLTAVVGVCQNVNVLRLSPGAKSLKAALCNEG